MSARTRGGPRPIAGPLRRVAAAHDAPGQRAVALERLLGAGAGRERVPGIDAQVAALLVQPAVDRVRHRAHPGLDGGEAAARAAARARPRRRSPAAAPGGARGRGTPRRRRTPPAKGSRPASAATSFQGAARCRSRPSGGPGGGARACAARKPGPAPISSTRPPAAASASSASNQGSYTPLQHGLAGPDAPVLVEPLAAHGSASRSRGAARDVRHARTTRRAMDSADTTRPATRPGGR